MTRKKRRSGTGGHRAIEIDRDRIDEAVLAQLHLPLDRYMRAWQVFIASERPDTMPDHADYAAALRKTHARKSSFWRQMDPNTITDDAELGVPLHGRRPRWVAE